MTTAAQRFAELRDAAENARPVQSLTLGDGTPWGYVIVDDDGDMAFAAAKDVEAPEWWMPPVAARQLAEWIVATFGECEP